MDRACEEGYSCFRLNYRWLSADAIVCVLPQHAFRTGPGKRAMSTVSLACIPRKSWELQSLSDQFWGQFELKGSTWVLSLPKFGLSFCSDTPMYLHGIVLYPGSLTPWSWLCKQMPSSTHQHQVPTPLKFLHMVKRKCSKGPPIHQGMIADTTIMWLVWTPDFPHCNVARRVWGLDYITAPVFISAEF